MSLVGGSNEAPMAPPPMAQPLRSYSSTAQCASGEWKTFNFEVEHYRAARAYLDDLIKNN
jgi:hypothetical protein